MPRTKRTTGEADGLSKFQRYRKTQQGRGMKLLRIWVPDPHNPGFAEESERQAALLRGHPDEKEAMDFIEATFEWPEP